MDLYNVFNSSAVTSANFAFGAWLTPSAIVPARFVRFGAQFNF